jgi:hypothetical protein
MNDQFTDRYAATGTPYPESGRSCDRCEGMGLYPQQVDTLNAEACSTDDGRLIIVGQKESDGSPCPDDGWVFVQCPDCKGKRVRSE